MKEAKFTKGPQEEIEFPSVRIEGPTLWGAFFIRNTHGHIWDGEQWRGFGCPWYSFLFNDTFKMAQIAESKLVAGQKSDAITDDELLGFVM